MSDTEKKPETEDLEALLPEDSEHEIEEFDDLEDFDPSEEDSSSPTPRLKDFLHSPDSPSRYLTILSLVFAFLAASCFGVLVFQYIKHRHSVQKHETLPEIVKLEPIYQQKVNDLQVMWNDGELRADMVVQCSTIETCEEIKARKTEVRDLTLPILQTSSRMEILNPVKKLRLRQQITDALNTMKLSGKVIEVNFTDLMVENPH
ncbi:MAG: hypothetical protein JWL77_7095 [Chthonomonadaceae bacterium]|nr:hypothetical protein [Chthonomonadaceae bacterium]